jgi:hypothetical protein
VTAIFHEDDVPADWAVDARIDREFFGPEVTGLGSPGGAVRVGSAGVDHPLLGSLVPA